MLNTLGQHEFEKGDTIRPHSKTWMMAKMYHFKWANSLRGCDSPTPWRYWTQNPSLEHSLMSSNATLRSTRWTNLQTQMAVTGDNKPRKSLQVDVNIEMYILVLPEKTTMGVCHFGSSDIFCRKKNVMCWSRLCMKSVPVVIEFISNCGPSYSQDTAASLMKDI